jgi:hypothetical protein
LLWGDITFWNVEAKICIKTRFLVSLPLAMTVTDKFRLSTSQLKVNLPKHAPVVCSVKAFKT